MLFYLMKMGNLDFWITLVMMTLLFIIVVLVKSIPKDKLPYCLGGNIQEIN